MATSTEYVRFSGGLNLTASSTDIPPGELQFAKNFEAATEGGYRRIKGYSRTDGVTSYVGQQYHLLAFDTGSSEIQVGDTITGATSGASALVVDIFLTSSIWNGNAAGSVVIVNVVGSFVHGETLTSSGVASPDGSAVAYGTNDLRGLSTKATDTAAQRATELALRDTVNTISGVGPLRGVWLYNDTYYVARDQLVADLTVEGTWSDATDTDVYVANDRTAGRVSVTNRANSVMAIVESGLAANDFVAAAISSSDLSTGTAIVCWAKSSVNTALGDVRLIMDNTAGGGSLVYNLSFPALKANEWTECVLAYDNSATGGNAIISVGLKFVTDLGHMTFSLGQVYACSGSIFKSAKTGWTAIKTGLIPGGKYEFLNHNFGGHAGTVKMYGVDGENPAFQWDGSTYTAISTGMTTDTPNHLEAHKNRLFLSFAGGSIQSSAAGTPTSFTVITGASEIGIGEECTSLRSIKGQSLAIFGRNKKFVLYGSNSSDFNLVLHSGDTGAYERTVQDLGDLLYMDDRGLTSFAATDTFGDFATSTWSSKIQPLIDAKRSKVTCSVVSRTKNQYRIFFTDGTALYCTIVNGQVIGIMPVDLGLVVRCAFSLEDSTGKEIVCVGSDSSYIYHLDSGKTFDGEPFESVMRLNFNHSQSPRMQKRYRKAIFDIKADTDTAIQVLPIFGYGNSDIGSASYIEATMRGEGNKFNDVEFIDDPVNVAYQQIFFWTEEATGAGAKNLLERDSYGKWIAMGASGALAYSYDGDTWTAGTSTAVTFNALRYADGVWVAVGPTGSIYTSTNGESWTSRTSGVAVTLNALFHDGDTTWVVVGNTGTILSSTDDGVTWTSRTSGTSANLLSVTHNLSDKWIVGGAGTPGPILSSIDASEWSVLTGPGTKDISIVDYSGDGKWIAVGGVSHTDENIYVSRDLETWTVSFSNTETSAISALRHSRNKLVVASHEVSGTPAKLAYSTDLVNWNERVFQSDGWGGGVETVSYLYGHSDGTWGICCGQTYVYVNDPANDEVQYVSEAEVNFDGHGTNLSMSIRTFDDTTADYTLQGVHLHWTRRGIKR